MPTRSAIRAALVNQVNCTQLILLHSLKSKCKEARTRITIVEMAPEQQPAESCGTLKNVQFQTKPRKGLLTEATVAARVGPGVAAIPTHLPNHKDTGTGKAPLKRTITRRRMTTTRLTMRRTTTTTSTAAITTPRQEID